MEAQNQETIERLYAALGRRDGEAMARCYTETATFTDPAFGALEGPEVGAMWRLLTSRSSDIVVQVSNIVVTGEEGSARWVARYGYGPKSRPVINRISARYRFRDGLIDEHIDSFSMWRWTGQALGWLGWIFGWTPMVTRRVQAQARASLDRAMGADDDSSEDDSHDG